MQSLEELENEFLTILNKPIKKPFEYVKKEYPKPKEHKEMINDMEKELEEIKKHEIKKMMRKFEKMNERINNFESNINKKVNEIKEKKIKIVSITNEINNIIYGDVKKNDVKPLKSYFVKKNNYKIIKDKKTNINSIGGYVQKFVPDVDLEISDDNLPLVGRRIYNIYKKFIKKITKREGQGVEYAMKVIFKYPAENDDKEWDDKKGKYINIKAGEMRIISKVFRNEQSISSISRVIKQELIDHFKQGYQSPVLSHIDFYVFPLNKKGGCSSCYTSKGQSTYNKSTIKLISPKS